MYKMMFIIGLISCIFFFLVSVVIFVKNDIIKIIGDITGINAKRAMSRMQKEKEEKKALHKSNDIRDMELDPSQIIEEITFNKEDLEEKEQDENSLIQERHEVQKNTPNGSMQVLFEEEEDMLVLGGRMQRRVSAGTDLQSEMEGLNMEEPETGVLSAEDFRSILENEEQTEFFAEGFTDALTEEEPVILSDDTTDVLMEETVILSEDATDVLTEDNTVILEQEGETDVLYK